MPALLIPLLSGAVVAATPITPQPWFEFRDYPMKAFDEKWEGVTRFDLLVAPDGKVAECKVTQSSGHQILDERACFLATKRAKFAPARGPGGEPVYGIFRTQTVWVLPERKMLGAAPGPDLEVSLNKLPDGTLDPPVVKVAYAVDPQGQPSSCSLMRSAPVQPEVLVQLACKQILQTEAHQPVLGPAGRAVEAVKTAAVRFKAPD